LKTDCGFQKLRADCPAELPGLNGETGGTRKELHTLVTV
jgi:hypothetical protein